MSETESSAQRDRDQPTSSSNDPYLALLVRVLESLARSTTTDSPPSIAVSVVVGGQLWAGQLVSTESWQLAVIRSARSSSNSEEFGEALAEMFERVQEMAEPGGDPVGFVHLIDAHPVELAGPSVVGGFPMRFRLGDIQAWTAGKPGARR